ncbi:MAG: tRNA lysidine(34) synthetase TilS [Gammaproteobacteria bacterium]|nr:tRNA lysidine(34) synthetase TilS [Gammaproteobacteria bacterium]
MAADEILDAYRSLAPHGDLWVAFSGGLDSTVLLHLLSAAGLQPRAIHVNHQLQPAAAGWVRHCARVCKALRVPLTVANVRVPSDDPAGPEAAARQARRGAFRKHLRKSDVLATAHHREDQAETLLLRIFRGTGLRGLAAMRPVSEFAPGRLWRPLLDVPRSALRAYAQAHRLRWIEDPHNDDPRYTRSWLRAQVLPLLRRRWPALDENLARLARLAAEADELLREQARADLDLVAPALPSPLATARMAEVRREAWMPEPPGEGGPKGRERGRAEGRSGGAPASLSVPALLGLGAARRHNALRAWIEAHVEELPSADWLDRLDREVLAAALDATPMLALGEYELRRYRDRLHLMPRLPPAPGGVELEWKTARLELPPGCGRLLAGRKPQESLIVRFPRGGERIKPAGARHTRTLKNLFQESGVAPWLRERMPLIYRGGQLAAVADLWMTAEFKAYSAQRGLEIRWRQAAEMSLSAGLYQVNNMRGWR